jgi:1-acyl-sn-glycerol-3-phosphate acyltransferase
MSRVDRGSDTTGWKFHPLCREARAADAILIIFPEGTRGEPDRLSPFNRGIAHLAKKFPEVPFVPVRLRGFGKVLPRGAVVPLPYCCEASVGEPLFWNGSTDGFMRAAEGALAEEGRVQMRSTAHAAAAHSVPFDPATAFAAR